MRYTVCGLFVALIMVLTPPFVWASASQTQTPAEPGKVLVEEEILYFFVDEPEGHFHQAHENFLKKDFKGAAAEIRKTTNCLVPLFRIFLEMTFSSDSLETCHADK